MPEADSAPPAAVESDRTPTLTHPARVLLRRSMHIFALVGFAVAQPLFGLLGSEPEFWIARGSTWLDVAVLLLLVVVVAPAMLVGVDIVAEWINPRLGAVVHTLIMWGLLFLVMLNVVDTVTGRTMRGLYVIVIAAILAAVGVMLYSRFVTVQEFLSILVVAPIVFSILLILSLPPLGGTHADAVDVGIDSDAPVVVVVLDEFPVNSIQRVDGSIDETRFPNLARLAEMSTWYPNATTVHDNTLKAVPAILAGRYPEPELQATAADYPDNLFTLLASTHEMRVIEGVTQLCPSALCDDLVESESTIEHLDTLVADTAIVYLHTIVPATVEYRLPPIGTRWSNFLAEDAAASTDLDDAGEYERMLTTESTGDPRAASAGVFLDSFDPALGAALYYLHVDVPHAPWSFLPDGRRYAYSDIIPGQPPDGIWSSDEWLSQQAYLRFMLNAGYADRLVGMTLDRLQSLGMLDDSMVVFLSDHGENFMPDQSRRAITSDTLAAVGGIPMFVKYPGQSFGSIDTRSAQSIDVVPTVVEALGGMWEFGPSTGRSLLHGDPDASKVMLTNAGARYELTAEEYRSLAERSRQAIHDVLPSGVGFSGAFAAA
ncbi:MAG: sulfatase-like hydrolase/transferase, partial [Acidimicrobiia bacterium]|nr:sulfatase-like hydrolase/transferase [Acidimicrobiia bacterium]